MLIVLCFLKSLLLSKMLSGFIKDAHHWARSWSWYGLLCYFFKYAIEPPTGLWCYPVISLNTISQECNLHTFIVRITLSPGLWKLESGHFFKTHFILFSQNPSIDPCPGWQYVYSSLFVKQMPWLIINSLIDFSLH